MFSTVNPSRSSRPPELPSVLFGLLLTVLAMPSIAEPGFDHRDLETVLRTFVDAQGLVDYDGLSEFRGPLDDYLRVIQEKSPENAPELFLSRDHELAFYINAYNALVLGKVLEKGPDLTSVWGRTGSGFGFFIREKVVVGGRKTSLKALEDDVIRAGFKDPRIHAALNCASLGCPRLPRVPFQADRLQQQLDTAMTEFVSDSRHVREEEGRLRLSKIFDWFKKDFLEAQRLDGAAKPSLAGYINLYRPRGRELDSSLPVSFLPYDKGLNSQP